MLFSHDNNTYKFSTKKKKKTLRIKYNIFSKKKEKEIKYDKMY